VFAVDQTAVKITSSAISADDVVNSGGGTATIVDATISRVTIRIPALGVNTTLNISDPSGDTRVGSQWARATYNVFDPNTYKYVLTGQWQLRDSSDSFPTNLGEFVVGYQTPAGGVPISGTAAYRAGLNGVAFFPKAASGLPYTAMNIFGGINFAIDFSSGKITGFANDLLIQSTQQGPFTWNDVYLTATLSGRSLTGSIFTPTADNAPAGGLPQANSFQFAGGATGTVQGSLYGPSADELGGIWTLSDGTNSAIGTLLGSNTGPGVLPVIPVSIGAPDAATAGSNPPTTAAGGFQQASPGGPKFKDIQAGPPFALTQTVLKVTDTAITGDAAVEAAGGTVSLVQSFPAQLHLKVPGLGLDTTITTIDPLSPIYSGYQEANSNYLTMRENSVDSTGMSYTELGVWARYDSATQKMTDISEWIAGYQTPPSAMPTSGTATYSRTNGVSGVMLTPHAGNQVSGAIFNYALVNVSGDVSLNADFASGNITGAFSHMISGGQPNDPWNDVSVTATISGANLAGTVATTNATALSMHQGATGTIRGGFYGPAADQIAAVWTLSDGANSAIGTVSANKAAPSDRRLKRDVVPLGRTAGGIELYSFRYLGDERLFIGVMAQDLVADPRFAAAVVLGEGGFWWVDYGLLGLDPPDLEEMVDAGRGATRRLH
jgi:hypothetical protein